jgi:hypothetical protein
LTRLGYVSSRTEKTIKAKSVIEFAKVPSLEPVRMICSVFTIALGYEKWSDSEYLSSVYTKR